MEPTLTRLMTSKVFGFMSSEQRDGVIQALLLTLVGPRGSTDSERQGLRRRLLQLPWAWEPCDSGVDGLVDRSDALLVRLEIPRLLPSLGRSIARKVGGARVREGVLMMMVLLFYADGGTDGELAILAPFREAMEIPVSRESWIIDQLRLELTESAR